MATQHVMRHLLTFQFTKDNVNWEDYAEAHAYINGLSGTEFFIANAGYDSSLMVNIECRYDPMLMRIIPNMFRAVDIQGTIYELVSPPDDVQLRHKTIKFRAKRVLA